MFRLAGRVSRFFPTLMPEGLRVRTDKFFALADLMMELEREESRKQLRMLFAAGGRCMKADDFDDYLKSLSEPPTAREIEMQAACDAMNKKLSMEGFL